MGDLHSQPTAQEGGRLWMHAAVCWLRNVILITMGRGQRYQIPNLVLMGVRKGHKASKSGLSIPRSFIKRGMNTILVFFFILAKQNCLRFSLSIEDLLS